MVGHITFMKLSSAILLFLILASLVTPGLTRAKVADWQKGASVYPANSDDFGSSNMKNLLNRLAIDHVNYVTLVIPYYQTNFTGSKMAPGFDTPSDESIIQATKWAHRLGIAVMLKPHLDSQDAVWRADINPKDRDGWYTNYETMLLHYAILSQLNGIEQICIGTELISVASGAVNPDNTRRFKKIIADMRHVYDGKLTYSANWGPSTSTYTNEKDHIGFWDDLDYIGISAYFQLNTSDHSVVSLSEAWDKWNRSDILPLQQKFQKPILFTEVGYRSSQNAAAKPYDYQKKGIYDPTEQANAYEALFGYWDDKPYIAGLSLWDFSTNPNVGGEGNTDYTPQDKPAENVLAKWYGKNELTETKNTPEKRVGFWSGLVKSIIGFRLISTIDL
jgi:hypothetical protein